MAIRTFITPKAGSGAVNLRSANKLDPANVVGLINEGTRVEYFSQTGSWYVGKVYVSTQGAEVVNHQLIKLKASNDFVNLRSSPVVENNTDVGDLKQGQQLELIATMGEWLVGKVYLSASWCELVTEGQPDLPVPIADGFDAPIGSPQERAGAQLWPGAWFDATPFGTRYDATGRPAIHTGADLNLPNDQDALAPVYAAASGIVRVAAAFPAWGNLIVVEHQLQDSTPVWTRYAHLNEMIVQVNQVVQRGQMIGRVGNAFNRYAYHLHYDVARIDLGKNPADWPGDDPGRVMLDYLDPLAFTTAHRPPQAKPRMPLLIGLHDRDGADWMKQNSLKGVCLVLAQVQEQPLPLDFSDLAKAGITVLLRIGYGYADGAGTIPRPDQLAAFEKAVAQTLNNAKGVTATHYCNEINNASEAPGWNPEVNAPGPDYFPLTPDYYIQSYNRVWYKIRTDVKLGPAPLDPYYGPPFPYLAYSSNNRDWWQAIVKGIAGADALFFHSKTQDNNPDNIWSPARFGGDPLTWQYFHFRTIENGLNDVPNRFKTLPVYLTEVNPQVKSNKRLGWEANNGKWVTECVNYLQNWNAAVGTQPVNGAIFYRWANDELALENKPVILGQIKLEAKKLGIGG
jgi:hypothetical protein